jgi:hypothetical protein
MGIKLAVVCMQPAAISCSGTDGIAPAAVAKAVMMLAAAVLRQLEGKQWLRWW